MIARCCGLLVLTAKLIVHGAQPCKLLLLRAGAGLVAVALGDETLDGGRERGGFAYLRVVRGISLTLIPPRLDTLHGKECGVDRSGALERLDHVDSLIFMRTRQQ
jgi:hypothetical protein